MLTKEAVPSYTYDSEGNLKTVVENDSRNPINNSDKKWGRECKDMIVEWIAHDDIYGFYPNERCKHVDFDYNDKNATYQGFWQRAFWKGLKQIW